jgi:hypothetical protein
MELVIADFAGKPEVLSYYPVKLFGKPYQLPMQMSERPKGIMN